MDYLNTFIENCKAYLKSQSVKVPNAATKSQQKFEFKQELNRKIQNLEPELSQLADKWSELAYKNEQTEVGQLRPKLTNVIRTILTEFRYEQEENSGLYK